MPYARWTAGKTPRLSAGGWNAAMAAAEQAERARRGFQVPGEDALPSNRTIVQVRNGHSEPVRRGGVLGLDEWLMEPDTDERLYELNESLCLRARAPALGTHDDQFVVLLQNLDPGEIGDAVLVGLVLVQVEITHASHKFCTIADGVTQNLKSAASGRGRILKAQSGTGIKWALVELGSYGPTRHRGIVDNGGPITKGSSGTVKRYAPGTTTPGESDTVWAELAGVANGKVVYYEQNGSKLYIYAVEKSSQTLLSNLRIKSGNTQIEAEDLDVWVETTDTPAYADKIPLTACT